MFSHLSEITSYLSTTISTAISIAIGTIQCVESVKRAGDFYPTREATFADGIGTLIGSLFGSILGMTSKSLEMHRHLSSVTGRCGQTFVESPCFSYFALSVLSALIGQPTLKKMGAKQGYSIVNGHSFLPLCFFGINGFLLSVIAIVSVNSIIVTVLIDNEEILPFSLFEDLYWFGHLR